ncbi:isocitrate lyase/PEP mutase family protein [Sphingomonas cavernae]|uniref:Isocitrate lyase/phosphoenolpyruvate mutase family protein n=1 Tax=Sphingomonas cavernae TaxID=2320861 RepID=A0A418WQL1_9SPHN|nr:isocitrate lyase/phosphoenolpyruvate mutase family protein [Sphingomonas cavernae]RJF93535.1 isocitrate lyase/phosphoenolpyruvate mutase family protein [Sphingomonas cavernae]
MNDRQREKARAFAALHVKGNPLILFNIWDAGSAKAVADAGAKALATGSWSVAAAHGLSDAEALPMTDSIANLKRITASVDLPVTLDFEGGYATEPSDVADNAAWVSAADGVGINFEDQIVGGEGLYSVADQSARIAAIRARTDGDFFINARTDIFLKANPETHDAAMLDAAIERASAYGDAGASGFFAPGLMDEQLIARLCAATMLPVNIMAFPGVPDAKRLGELGVARVSHGPGPYRQAMKALGDAAKTAFA